MNILHVIDSLDPRGGGPPMIAFRLAAGQAALGHDVHLATRPSPDVGPQIREALGGVPHAQSVHVHQLPAAGGMTAAFDRHLRRVLRSLVSNADVVHLHSVWEPLLPIAAAEAQRQRRPYFVLLNGMLDPWSLSQRWLKKRLALALVYRRMLNRAAALHVGNEDERRLIEPLALTAPAVIIPNGVFFEELDPRPPANVFQQMRPELKGRPYVLFLSRLHYKKGLDLLGEAFARVIRDEECRELQLVVAGPDGGACGDFERQVHDLGIAARVHLVGPLYGQDKLAALAGATCFCLPSRQEGFSIAITEALACGVPVVITENCHFPEVAEAGAGEVVPLDPETIAAAIVRVSTDPKARHRMGHAGRALVAANYTWDVIARRSIDLYVQSAQPQRT